MLSTKFTFPGKEFGDLQGKKKKSLENNNTQNFQIYKQDLEKAEKPEIKLSIFTGS